MTMTSLDRDPQLSVVVAIQRDSAHFRLMLRSIRAQSLSGQLELIIVTPPRLSLELDTDLDLLDYRVVEVASPATEGKAKAAGVAAARAPLVAFIEDHSYPDPQWGAAMVETHRELEDAAVVGPVMDNANPDSAMSWGCFLVFYSQWLTARGRETVSHLPANQSCYKRQCLLAYGTRLAEMLQAESVLHWDLANKGHRLVLLDSSRVFHLNYSNVAGVLAEYFFASRIFAANRASSWRLLRRACYALGSPLLPMIRLPRILTDTRRAGLKAAVVNRALAPAALILCAGAAGELLGYSFGSGATSIRLASMLQDQRLVTPSDLEQVTRLQKTQLPETQ